MTQDSPSRFGARLANLARGSSGLTALSPELRATMNRLREATKLTAAQLREIAEPALQLQQLSKQYAEALGPAYEQILNNHQAFEDAARNTNSILATLTGSIDVGLKAQLAHTGLLDQERFLAAMADWRESLKRLRVAFPTLEFDWEGLQAREASAFALAAKLGWYIQPETPWSIIELIEDCGEDASAMDQLFFEHIRALEGSIRDRLAQEFPQRAHIINEAFALHAEGRYYAAVPLLLSTADGIAKVKGYGQGKLYNSWKGDRTRIAEALHSSDVEQGARPVVDVLSGRHQLAHGAEGRWSRHGVLHGRDLAYGTQANCLQAIAFVGLVGWIFSPKDGLLRGGRTA